MSAVDDAPMMAFLMSYFLGYFLLTGLELSLTVGHLTRKSAA